MPYPVLVECRHSTGGRINIIFQGLSPRSDECRDGRISPAAMCDDDGTRFFQGHPSDYAGEALVLDDTPSSATIFVVTDELLEKVQRAKSCSFGVVDHGGCGPGFIFDGEDFELDEEIGVKLIENFDDAGRSRPELGVLISREQESHCWRYFDKEDEQEEEGIANGGLQNGRSAAEDGMDVDMDGVSYNEAQSSKQDKSPDSGVDFQEQLQSSMQKLRLREA